MDHLAILLIASLLFHTSSHTSQSAKPGNALKTMRDQWLDNMSLTVSPSQAFKAEQVEMRHEDMSHLFNTLSVPFVFSIFDSYDAKFTRLLWLFIQLDASRLNLMKWDNQIPLC